MKWHGVLGMYKKELRRHAAVMDNRSVVLLRLGDAAEDNRFLSLSPFVMDENTFEDVPDLSISKLYFFSHREGDQLCYKYVRDPEEDVINLDDPAFYLRKKKRSKFQLAKDQFEVFYQLIAGPEKPAAL